MDHREQSQRSWLESFRRLGGSAIDLAQARFELFAVELQEEKLRALSFLVWLAVAFMLALAGVLVGLGAVAILLWDAAGYGGLIGLVVVSLAGAGAVVWRIRNSIKTESPPFNETISEFRKDFQCLREKR